MKKREKRKKIIFCTTRWHFAALLILLSKIRKPMRACYLDYSKRRTSIRLGKEFPKLKLAFYQSRVKHDALTYAFKPCIIIRLDILVLSAILGGTNAEMLKFFRWNSRFLTAQLAIRLLSTYVSRWIPFQANISVNWILAPPFLPLGELIRMQAPTQANLHLETIFKSPFRRTGKSIVVKVIREASGSPFFLPLSFPFLSFFFSTVLVKTPETVELGTEYHKSAISESDAICYAD